MSIFNKTIQINWQGKDIEASTQPIVHNSIIGCLVKINDKYNIIEPISGRLFLHKGEDTKLKAISNFKLLVDTKGDSIKDSIKIDYRQYKLNEKWDSVNADFRKVTGFDLPIDKIFKTYGLYRVDIYELERIVTLADNQYLEDRLIDMLGSKLTSRIKELL